MKITLFLTKTRGILFLKTIDIFFFFAIMGLSKAEGRSRSFTGGDLIPSSPVKSQGSGDLNGRYTLQD